MEVTIRVELLLMADGSGLHCLLPETFKGRGKESHGFVLRLDLRGGAMKVQFPGGQLSNGTL